MVCYFANQSDWLNLHSNGVNEKRVFGVTVDGHTARMLSVVANSSSEVPLLVSDWLQTSLLVDWVMQCSPKVSDDWLTNMIG